MNKTIYLIMFISISVTALSQNTVQNLNKYWYYKQRLHENFMVVSPNNETGTNHPAIIRGYHAHWNNNITYIYVEDEYGNLIPVQQSWPVVSCGDNNAGLQNYIAVLATEYRTSFKLWSKQRYF